MLHLDWIHCYSYNAMTATESDAYRYQYICFVLETENALQMFPVHLHVVDEWDFEVSIHLQCNGRNWLPGTITALQMIPIILIQWLITIYMYPCYLRPEFRLAYLESSSFNSQILLCLIIQYGSLWSLNQLDSIHQLWKRHKAYHGQKRILKKTQLCTVRDRKLCQNKWT